MIDKMDYEELRRAVLMTGMLVVSVNRENLSAVLDELDALRISNEKAVAATEGRDYRAGAEAMREKFRDSEDHNRRNYTDEEWATEFPLPTPEEKP